MRTRVARRRQFPTTVQPATRRAAARPDRPGFDKFVRNEFGRAQRAPGSEPSRLCVSKKQPGINAESLRQSLDMLLAQTTLARQHAGHHGFGADFREISGTQAVLLHQ